MIIDVVSLKSNQVEILCDNKILVSRSFDSKLFICSTRRIYATYEMIIDVMSSNSCTS